MGRTLMGLSVSALLRSARLCLRVESDCVNSSVWCDRRLFVLVSFSTFYFFHLISFLLSCVLLVGHFVHQPPYGHDTLRVASNSSEVHPTWMPRIYYCVLLVSHFSASLYLAGPLVFCECNCCVY